MVSKDRQSSLLKIYVILFNNCNILPTIDFSDSTLGFIVHGLLVTVLIIKLLFSLNSRSDILLCVYYMTQYDILFCQNYYMLMIIKLDPVVIMFWSNIETYKPVFHVSVSTFVSIVSWLTLTNLAVCLMKRMPNIVGTWVSNQNLD